MAVQKVISVAEEWEIESEEETEEFDSAFIDDAELFEGVPLILVTIRNGYGWVRHFGRAEILLIDLDEVVAEGEDKVPAEAEQWIEVFPDLQDEIEEALQEHEKHNESEFELGGES